MAQMMIKLSAKIIFESAYLAKVLLNNKIKTHVMIPKGIMVISELTTLKISAALPSRMRWV